MTLPAVLYFKQCSRTCGVVLHNDFEERFVMNIRPCRAGGCSPLCWPGAWDLLPRKLNATNELGRFDPCSVCARILVRIVHCKGIRNDPWYFRVFDPTGPTHPLRLEILWNSESFLQRSHLDFHIFLLERQIHNISRTASREGCPGAFCLKMKGATRSHIDPSLKWSVLL